jgi:endoglycosylceramidase
MYVIVDMHQNAFSHFVGGEGDPSVHLDAYSGAPAWATFTEGIPSHALNGKREVNAAVLEATNNFWYDRAGIQDEYIAAFAQVVSRFKDDSVVAGFGLYNEPWFGWNLPPGFDDLLLFPFYRRVIDAVTGAPDGAPCWSGFFMPAVCGYRDLGVDDRRHLFFLDTGLLREVTDFPTHLGLPISSYPNLVLGYHAYTHIYTIDKLVGQSPRTAAYPWGGYDQGWDSVEREAKAMDMALFLEEFGNNPDDDDLILPRQLREADEHRVGWAFWTWKEQGQPPTWGVYKPPAVPTDPSGCIRTERERRLAAPYPRLSADSSLAYAYNSEDGSFTLRGRGTAGDASTVVYAPPEVAGPISATGGARLVISSEADGSRLVFAIPTGGEFRVTIAPAPPKLTTCQ